MPRQHNYFVYILLCADGSYYVGVTNNVGRRFMEHTTGLDRKAYTYRRRPLQLVHVERYQWVQHAIAREKQIKGWTRKKKQALIAGDDQLLSRYASTAIKQGNEQKGVTLRQAQRDS